MESEREGKAAESDEGPEPGEIPDDEREALETIAHGAVLTSGGASAR